MKLIAILLFTLIPIIASADTGAKTFIVFKPGNNVISSYTGPLGNQRRACYEAMRITSTGNVGIGTASPKSKLHVVGLPVYADNAAAKAGDLTVGAFYRTGDLLKVVH